MEPSTPVTTPQAKIKRPVELLVDAWDIFAKNWKILAQISALPFVCLIAAQLIAVVLLSGSRAPSLPVVVIFGAMVFVLYVGGVVLSIVQIPALIKCISRARTEPGAAQTIEERYKESFHYFWPYVLLCLVTVLAVAGSYVLLVIPGIILSVFIAMSPFALVVDDNKVFQSLIESYSLIRRRWWPVFGRVLFMAWTALIAYLLSSGLFFVIGLSVSSLAGGVTSAIVGTVLGFAMTVLIYSMSLAYMHGMYASLKSARVPGDAPVAAFKGWFIGFMCIGALALIFVIALPFMAFLK